MNKPGGVQSFFLLFGLASAAAVLLFVALALITIPMVGVLSVVAMYAIIRHAQFRRVRTALARGKLREPKSGQSLPLILTQRTSANVASELSHQHRNARRHATANADRKVWCAREPQNRVPTPTIAESQPDRSRR
jgi:hypothetical protein